MVDYLRVSASLEDRLIEYVDHLHEHFVNPVTPSVSACVFYRGGALHWKGETSTAELKRHIDELVAYLFREDEFPDGVILSTGTALVPDSPFTLEEDDVVEIDIDQLGTLRNPVVRGARR